MAELEAIRARHSVRQYLNKPLKPDELAELRAEVDACNKESGLHIQLVTNESKAFEGGKVSAVPGHAFWAKMDLGIAKYHFEVGAGKENFQWA